MTGPSPSATTVICSATRGDTGIQCRYRYQPDRLRPADRDRNLGGNQALGNLDPEQRWTSRCVGGVPDNLIGERTARSAAC
jgi:hypothetical protein